MGTPQLSILPYGQPPFIAGQITQKIDAGSAANKDSVNIDFGLGVKPGTYVKEALLPTASSSIFDGLVVWETVDAPGTFGNIDQSSATKGIKPNAFMTLLREGRGIAIVDADTTVTPNVTRLYWRFETDGASNTKVGTFRHSDDGHVVDTRNQVLAIGPIFTGPDGVQKLCEVYVSTSNKA